MPSETVTQYSDPTFRNNTFDIDKATEYAAHRAKYPKKLISKILDLHASTGGSNDMLLDVGCGPGNVLMLLARFFQRAIGADPGESMIEGAKSSYCTTASGEPAIFKVCAAEDLQSLVEPETVDLITAGTAAHWFDMPKFYTAASKILKPGGSIAMWCGGHHFVDPKTTPNAAEVQRLWNELEYDVLDPYMMPGNRKCRNLYRSMDMPWTIETQDSAMEEALECFDRSKSVRLEFNVDGIPDPEYTETNGFLWYETHTLEKIAKMLGTASAVIRWRESHREQLQDEKVEDIVEKYTRSMKETMGDEKRSLDIGIDMALILIKKKS